MRIEDCIIHRHVVARRLDMLFVLAVGVIVAIMVRIPYQEAP